MAFNLVFLIQTTPEEWLKRHLDNNPGLNELINKFKSQVNVSFPELFEEHFNLWDSELTSSKDEFISYIRMDIERVLKEINPKIDFERKSIILAGKYLKLIVEKRFENYDLNIQCGKIFVRITLKSLFHILWGHYLRFPQISIKERNKSIFSHHTDLQFIDETREILKEIHNYKPISGTKVSYNLEYRNVIHTIVATYIRPNEYELTTYFIVDRIDKLEKIKKRKKIKLDLISIFE